MRTLTTIELEALKWLDSQRANDSLTLVRLAESRNMGPVIARLKKLDLVSTRYGPRLTPKGRRQLVQIDEDALKSARWRANAGKSNGGGA